MVHCCQGCLCQRGCTSDDSRWRRSPAYLRLGKLTLPNTCTLHERHLRNGLQHTANRGMATTPGLIAFRLVRALLGGLNVAAGGAAAHSAALLGPVPERRVRVVARNEGPAERAHDALEDERGPRALGGLRVCLLLMHGLEVDQEAGD